MIIMNNNCDPSLDSLVYSYLVKKISLLKSCTKKFGKVIGKESADIKPNFDLEYYVNAGKHSTSTVTQTAISKTKVNQKMKLTQSNDKQINNNKTNAHNRANSANCSDSKSNKQTVITSDSTDDKPLISILSPISKTHIKSNTNTRKIKSQTKQASDDITIREIVNDYLDDSSEEEVPKSFSPVGDKNSTDEELPSISKISSLKNVETKELSKSLKETAKPPEIKKKRKNKNDNHSDIKHGDFTKSKKKIKI